MAGDLHPLMSQGAALYKQEVDLLLRKLNIELTTLGRSDLDATISRVFRKGYLAGFEDATVKSQEMVNRITSTLVRP
jgi:hypothetical protein